MNVDDAEALARRVAQLEAEVGRLRKRLGEDPAQSEAKPLPKRRLAVAEKPESADFLYECCPPPTSNILTLPREVKMYMRSLASRAASDFVLELIDQTYNASFNETYGRAAAELAEDETNHPRWASFTIADIARVTNTSESGTLKFIAELEKSGAIKSKRGLRRLWYSANIDRMVQLTKTRNHRKSKR